ncbi:MAG: AAA family ATPase [Steroidobacteraceae bacterium]|nr:AAA family ATPase [Steroidobacteraceae bacterium]
MLDAWLSPGIIVMDEPESALSPQRQLALLAKLWRLVARGDVQLVVATHSPILLTFPGASIWSFDGGRIEASRLEDTTHYQITRGILEHPQRYWRHLAAPPESGDV